MRRLLFLFVSLMSLASQAGTFRCSGQQEDFTFDASGTFAGNRVTGSVPVRVLSDGQVVSEMVLTIQSSDFREKNYLKLAGLTTNGMGILDARYTGGTSYDGVFSATIESIAVQPRVHCEAVFAKKLRRRVR